MLCCENLLVSSVVSTQGSREVRLQTQHSRRSLWALCTSVQWPAVAGGQRHHGCTARMPEWVMGQGSQMQMECMALVLKMDAEVINHIQPLWRRCTIENRAAPSFCLSCCKCFEFCYQVFFFNLYFLFIFFMCLTQECKCNGHASNCHFSRGLWMATGRRSGGVCDQCRHNTEGRRCQTCKRGYYRDASRPKNAADSCKRKSR